MDTRREYVKPGIESEEILEQTALQCSNSLDVHGTVPDPGCALKHNAFFAYYEGWEWCTVWPLYTDYSECYVNQVGFT